MPLIITHCLSMYTYMIIVCIHRVCIHIWLCTYSEYVYTLMYPLPEYVYIYDCMWHDSFMCVAWIIHAYIHDDSDTCIHAGRSAAARSFKNAEHTDAHRTTAFLLMARADMTTTHVTRYPHIRQLHQQQQNAPWMLTRRQRSAQQYAWHARGHKLALLQCVCGCVRVCVRVCMSVVTLRTARWTGFSKDLANIGYKCTCIKPTSHYPTPFPSSHASLPRGVTHS